MKKPIGLILVTILLFVFLSNSAQALFVYIDKNVYEVNETIAIKVNRTQDANITGIVVYRTNGTQADNFTIVSDGTTGMIEYSYPQTLPPGEYTLTLAQGSDSVQIGFKVVSEILKPVVRLMGSLEPIFINTSTEVKNETGGMGGNFSELLKFNKSAGIFYGYIGNLTSDGKTYHFVVVDKNAPGVYDTVYVDDDKDFRMFNDTEDNATSPFLETSKRPGDMLRIDSNHKYIIADTELATGKMVYLIKPLTSPTFSSSDTLYMLVFVMGKDGSIKKNIAVNISIASESKQLKYSQMKSTGSKGYVNVSVNLSGYSSGKYTILVNQTPSDVFKVESFNLHGKITDLSGNPMSVFVPGSKVKIWAISRNANGDLMDLDSVPNGALMLPDGSTSSLTFEKESGATGVYKAETSALVLTGEYKVTITGTKSTDTERFDTGFKVESIQMMVETVNPKYIDEGVGPGTMVRAFAPGSNVTAAIFMIDTTKGSGFKTDGPPCGPDGQSCVQINCDSSQFEVIIKDDFGNRYKLETNNFTVMTIEQFANSLGFPPPAEPGMKDQCTIVIWGTNNSWMNNTGNYKIEVKFSNSSVGNFDGGATFSIKRLLAMGSTVDFKGDTFSFLAPNSTVRVKLEIRDMVTDELLTADKILNAKFTEMWKEWPERKNAFTEMAGFDKTKLNESMDGDKIVFTSPPEEGFYTAEFRFSANVSGAIMEGTGTIFFELKKYLIWADLQTASEGNWYVKAGENISLRVNIMDIDTASQYGKGSTPTCTGCTGLVANISSLRNEQFFKEMKEGVDYTVTTGAVTNSTSGASILIHPINLPTGWYGVDIVLQNPETTEKYYGWGWFEIRNFWVDVFEVEEQEGNYTRKEGGKGGPGGTTVPIGGSTLLGVAAFSPPTPTSPPTPLTVSNVVSEGMQDESVWPPLPVPTSHYNVTGLGSETISEEWGNYEFYLINFSTSGSIKESRYMLNLRVTTQEGGTDIGTAGITVASYVVNYMSIPPTKMFEWPPVYASTENLTLMFNATKFDHSPHNITNVTVEEMFSEKAGRPIKFRFGQNYTNNCTGSTQSCYINVFLSGLSPGEYFTKFKVIDNSGSSQYEEYEFEIKNLLLSVPMIYEAWTREESTPDKNLDVWNGEDSCDNKMYLMGDNCPSSGDNVVCTNINGTTNLTIPDTKTANPYYADRICIYMDDGGRWLPSSAPGDTCPGAWVYVVSNGTNAWINHSTNLSSSSTLTNGSVFTLLDYPDMTWELYEFKGSEPSYIRIKHKGMICSRNEMGGGVLKIVPPAGHNNYSTFYHGPSYIVGDMWDQNWPHNGSLEYRIGITRRPVYVYHNTTHVWLYPNSTFANFTDSSKTQGPVAVGGVINDGYGGEWKIVSISNSRITLKGQNILANGIMVNTSLSTSGNVRVGGLREDEMGFENKFTNEKQGLDLDGDGLTNGTFFFLILDSSNGYDKLAFASNSTQKWNFTNISAVIDVNDNDRMNRQVGLGSDKLTLLSIDPRANRVMFYDPSATGDWPELGDTKGGNNVTIPVMVKSPDGSPIAANVSVPNMKVKTETGMKIVPTGLSPVEINGIGEIRINVSDLGYGSGRYEFEVFANSTTLGAEKMNEWMWPRTTVRNFLIDSYPGYGGLVTSFVSISVDSYGGWGSEAKIRELFTINNTGSPAIRGVMQSLDHELPYPPGCPNFEEPPDAGADSQNKTYALDRFDNQYYAYLTPANATVMWVNQGDCNFTNANTYNEGDPINITIGSEKYMLYVLSTNMSNASIGLLNLSDIPPIRMDDWNGNPSPKWFITSVNRSGTIYNVVFANDSMPYPQAGTWGIQEVSKVVWMDTDGDFSDANKYAIGENFTANEYVVRVGPSPWEGLIIADSSNLSGIGVNKNPGMDLKLQDNTPVYFGKVNESDPSLLLDLNMDNDTKDVFYVVAFDEFEDGVQEVTRFYVDDDLNITEPWWANSSNIQEDQTYTYYDFYGNEYNMPEQEGNPPKGMWGGNIRFAPLNQSQSLEESAEWRIRAYNGTKMILEKDVRQLDKNKTISLTIKVFDFAQSPISGANVSLTKLMRFGGGQPFKELNESAGDFTLIQAQNVTDSRGYAMLKLAPPVVGWMDNADYIAVLEVEYEGMTETVDTWFRIGQRGGMP